MRCWQRMAVVGLGVLGLGALSIQPAEAQRTRRPADQQDLPPSVPPPIPDLNPTRGIAGTKLDPGAVLCGTQEDLRHRFAVTQARAQGEPDAGDPLAGCHILQQTRGVDVMSRAGLNMVQVKVKPGGEVGWTDAYIH